MALSAWVRRSNPTFGVGARPIQAWASVSPSPSEHGWNTTTCSALVLNPSTGGHSYYNVSGADSRNPLLRSRGVDGAIG